MAHHSDRYLTQLNTWPGSNVRPFLYHTPARHYPSGIEAWQAISALVSGVFLAALFGSTVGSKDLPIAFDLCCHLAAGFFCGWPTAHICHAAT